MNIWIDIFHPAQLNFYSSFIKRLNDESHNVFVTVLNRGKLPEIAHKEFDICKHITIDVIGKHRLNKYSAIIDANLRRTIQAFNWSLHKGIDIAFSNGWQSSFVGKILGFPVYTFDDDPQTLDYRLKLLFSTKSHYCLYRIPSDIKLSSNIKIVKALKEWSYLNPKVFKPNLNILEEYGLEPYSYIFIREISVGTVNYSKQDANSVLTILKDIPSNVKVLFSLEEKEKRNLFPKEWILLQEPVKDIHSLIYYSKCLISSGDSMAREAVMLGIPSLYVGIRHDMPANIVASEVAQFYNTSNLSVEDWIQKYVVNPRDYETDRTNTITNISTKFDDINEYIYSLLSKK